MQFGFLEQQEAHARPPPIAGPTTMHFRPRPHRQGPRRRAGTDPHRPGLDRQPAPSQPDPIPGRTPADPAHHRLPVIETKCSARPVRAGVRARPAPGAVCRSAGAEGCAGGLAAVAGVAVLGHRHRQVRDRGQSSPVIGAVSVVAVAIPVRPKGWAGRPREARTREREPPQPAAWACVQLSAWIPRSGAEGVDWRPTLYRDPAAGGR